MSRGRAWKEQGRKRLAAAAVASPRARTFCSVRSLRPSGSHFITPCLDFIQLTLPRSVLISPVGAGAWCGVVW